MEIPVVSHTISRSVIPSASGQPECWNRFTVYYKDPAPVEITKQSKAIWFSWVRKEEKSGVNIELAEGLGYLIASLVIFLGTPFCDTERSTPTCLTEQWWSKAKKNIWEMISKHTILIWMRAWRCNYDTAVIGLPACVRHGLCPGKMRPYTYHPDTCSECFFL